MKYREPSKLEMQVLSVLWARGASTVREVMAVMPDGKTRAYTTILSVIQVMEKKGLVSHVAEGNVHVYQARVSRQKVTGPLLRGLVEQIFGGSTATALQHLLAEERVSRQELDEIKQIIAWHETGREGAGEASVRKKGKA
jgi:BlaI family penicillinase repressor